MFKHEPFSRGKKKILNTFFPIEQTNKKNQRSFFYSTFSNKKEFVFMFKHEPFSRGKKKILNTFFPIEQTNKKNQRSFFYSTFSNKKEFVFMFKHEPFSRGKKKILNWGRWPTGSVVLCSVCCVCSAKVVSLKWRVDFAPALDFHRSFVS